MKKFLLKSMGCKFNQFGVQIVAEKLIEAGFGQAIVRNGGRNGVALTFGFRWALGKNVDKL